MEFRFTEQPDSVFYRVEQRKRLSVAVGLSGTPEVDSVAFRLVLVLDDGTPVLQKYLKVLSEGLRLRGPTWQTRVEFRVECLSCRYNKRPFMLRAEVDPTRHTQLFVARPAFTTPIRVMSKRPSPARQTRTRKRARKEPDSAPRAKWVTMAAPRVQSQITELQSRLTALEAVVRMLRPSPPAWDSPELPPLFPELEDPLLAPLAYDWEPPAAC